MTIAYDRTDDFLEQGCDGLCRMIPPLKSATISILHPNDYPNDARADIEQVVVHEMLHLHFVMFTPAPDGDDAPLMGEQVLMEQATDIIAKALVAAQRSPV